MQVVSNMGGETLIKHGGCAAVANHMHPGHDGYHHADCYPAEPRLVVFRPIVLSTRANEVMDLLT